MQITFRAKYSIQHVLSADHFATLSADIETAYDSKFSDDLFARYKAYIAGSIFAAVAFLEATINELFADAVDNPYAAVKQLDSDVVALMANMWEELEALKRVSTLNKFQIALTLANKERFDKGRSPYQDVQFLVALRNALVHYRPEWTATVSSDHQALTVHKLEAKLGGKFPLSPLTAQGNPFFPDKCLSYGCAKWAVISSVKFVDEFYSRMGLTPTFDHVRSRLKTVGEHCGD